MAEAGAMLTAYLAAERGLGRVSAGADLQTLAPMLLGAGHLLFAGRDGTPPDPAEVTAVVTAALAGVLNP